MAGRDDRIPELVAGIYEAALDVNAWGAVIEQFAAAMGGGEAKLSIRAMFRGAGQYGTQYAQILPHTDHEVIRAHEELVGRSEPARMLAQTPAGSIWPIGTWVSERDWERSEIYNDFVRPRGLGIGAITTIIENVDGQCVVALGMLRDRGLGHFDHHDVAFVERLMPHFRHAIRIMQRLELADEALGATAAVLDAVPVAVFVLSQRGRVMLANRRAEELVSEGSALCTRNRTLIGATPSIKRALAERIGAAIEAHRAARADTDGAARADYVGALRVPVLGSLHALEVIVVPIVRETSPLAIAGGPAAAVFVSDPDRPVEIPSEPLCEIFGLTPTEAEVAVHIALGRSPAQIATALGVQANTVRVHLKSVYAKTNTHRQAELAARILTSAIGVRR